MTHLIKSTLVIALTLCIYAPRSGVAHYTDDAISNASSSQQQAHTTQSVVLEQLITAPTKSMCKEACWAQSASDRELRGKYGSAKIPARFKFADRFYRKGEAVYMSCMRPHGPMGVMNKAISRRCTEKSNRVCTEACKAALSK